MVDPSVAPDPPFGFPNPPRDRLEFWVRVIFWRTFRGRFQRAVMASLFLRRGIWLADGSYQWRHLGTRARTLWGQSLDLATRLQMATMVVRGFS